MEINTFDDIVKMHEEFSIRLAERLNAPAGRASNTLEALMEQKRELLEHTSEANNKLYRAKAEAVKRLDDEIERNKRLILELEHDIAVYEESIQGRDDKVIAPITELKKPRQNNKERRLPSK
jgi:hypothetical protein